MPEGVIAEALKRYYAGEKLVMVTTWLVSPADTTQKQEIKRTITYV
ncbi:MAG: hypothetical protein LBB61_10615 [Treponema sp.]|jgi:hypothetical protein|nr:hypothetical protein [Treponema sp.]